MKKEDLLAELLIKNDLVKNYVFICEDLTGRYLKYAFTSGYPDNFKNLPQWSSELPANDGSIYELSGYAGDHWCFQDAKPIDVKKLCQRKFELSVDEIMELFQK